MEKSAQHCGEQIKDVQRVQGEIKQSLTQETALKSELGGLNGIFKKKAREDCQRRLEEQQKEIETIRERKITVKLSDADCDRLARKCGLSYLPWSKQGV